jgi:hypothetical protein
MKFAFLAAGAAALVTAAPAFADTASTNVQVTGTVGSQCGVGNQSGGGTRVTDSSGVVPLGNLVGPTGQLSIPQTVIGFDNLWCNSASSLTMTVTALKTNVTVSDTSSFTNHLDMIVSHDSSDDVLIYFGNPSSVSTGAGGADGTLTSTLPTAFETGTGTYSRALLNVTLPAGTQGNDRPVAGSYTGTVTITATPS